MSVSLLTPTEEPQVTDRTRFWLFSELSTTYYRSTANGLDITHGPRLRIKAEVNEAAYRQAYAVETDQAADITVPLDDHWWNHRAIAGRGVPDGWALYRSRGGYIDWEPWP